MGRFFVLMLVVFVSCDKDVAISNSGEESAAIEVVDPKWNLKEAPYPTGAESPYPLMNTPSFKSVKEIDELRETDQVGLVSFNNIVKVYPYLYNNIFEVVNDSIGEYYYAFTFCPQTKSAIAYNRIVKNDTLDLIASGYLYKENMVPSDTEFNYFWSQMLMKGINDAAENQQIKTFNHIQTTWKTVVDNFPDAQVFYIENTSSAKQGNTAVKNSVPEEAADVFAIIENFNSLVKDETVHAFPLNQFEDQVAVKKMIVDGEDVILISSKQHYFYTAFIVPPGITFKALNPDVFPPVLEDFQGNLWNAFGYAFEGPNKGAQLKSPKAYIALWWAWKLFYENIAIKL